MSTRLLQLLVCLFVRVCQLQHSGIYTFFYLKLLAACISDMTCGMTYTLQGQGHTGKAPHRPHAAVISEPKRPPPQDPYPALIPFARKGTHSKLVDRTITHTQGYEAPALSCHETTHVRLLAHYVNVKLLVGDAILHFIFPQHNLGLPFPSTIFLP